MNISNIHKRMSRGYTLLFAVITASLVLGVAVFILSVSKKQYELAVTARESMYSFYAADSGMECASVALSAGTLIAVDGGGVPQTATMVCAGAGSSQNFTAYSVAPWVSGQAYKSDPIYIGLGGGSCAEVTVYDGMYTTTTSGDQHRTVIESRGYNQCNATTHQPLTSTRTVERALRLTYQ